MNLGMGESGNINIINNNNNRDEAEDKSPSKKLLSKDSIVVISYPPIEDRIVDEEQGREIICGICCELLNNPMQCGNGHLFCQECIVRALELTNKCPTCRCKLTEDTLSSNLFVKQFINNLLFHCKFKYSIPNSNELAHNIKYNMDENGCPTQLKLLQLENHEKECEYSWIRCLYTYSTSTKYLSSSFHMVRKRDWDSHKLTCHLRPAICQHCDSSVSFFSLSVSFFCEYFSSSPLNLISARVDAGT